MQRYFLDKHGAKTTRMQGKPGDGHLDIAKEQLTGRGIKPVDRADYYIQMFRLRFARVVEHDDGTVELEYRGKLTAAQRRFVDELQREGRTVRLLGDKKN